MHKKSSRVESRRTDEEWTASREPPPSSVPSGTATQDHESAEVGDSPQAGTTSVSEPAARQSARGTETSRTGTGDPREEFVSYETGPSGEQLAARYGTDLTAGEVRALQRLESDFGTERVQRWADEGMPVETMGKPRDMAAFRARQAERPDQGQADSEQRNAASPRRHEGQNRDTADSKRVLARERAHVRQQTERMGSPLPETDANRGTPGVDTTVSVQVQPRLEVSSPDDPSEKEAERVAEQVVEMEAPSDQSPEGDDREGGQRPPGVPAGVADAVSRSAVGRKMAEQTEASVRRGVRGGGKPLPAKTRAVFESKMGTDFSDVRVHTGSTANEATQSINAKAYTMGTDIAFADGEYSPESRSGRKLLAHELTHVVQQGGAAPTRPSRVQRQQLSESELKEIGLEPEGVSDDVAGFLSFCSDIETVANMGIDLAQIGGAITQGGTLYTTGSIAAPISLLITGLTQWADALQAQKQWGAAQGTAYAIVSLANGQKPPGPHDQFGDDGKEGWQSAVQRVESALNAETEQQIQTLRGMYTVSDQDPRTALNRTYHDIVENQMQDYFLGLLPAGGNLYNIARKALLMWPGPGMVLEVDEERVKEVLSGEAEE